MLIGYWEFFPKKPFVLVGNPHVVEKVYHPGDKLVYTFSYCKSEQITGELFRTLVNGTITTFTTIPTNLPTGCHTFTKDDLVLPDYLDEDIYHLEVVAKFYKINPLRDYHVSWRSQDFRITK